MNKRYLKILYVALIALMCLVPSVGFLVGAGDEAADSSKAERPSLFEEGGGINQNLLQDFGSYFESHAALRNQYISLNSLIDEELFGVSSQSGDGGVVVGTNGWLYYADSLDDYLGTNQLSDRALFDISRQLKMMQDYAKGKGADFVFTIAPNKNSLYPGYMPYYYKNARVTDEGNLQRIEAFLEEQGVNYVPLFDLLYSQDEVLYHARDSHWNNKGAALVADAVLSELDQVHKDYGQIPSELRCDYVGDLEKMLYPAWAQPENQVYFQGGQSFEYLTEVESNFDPKIETCSETGEGSLVMYRDSFGNSLLPFFAESYTDAYFSRGVPYQLAVDLLTHDADAVVVERAQRFLPDMAANAPMIPAVPADEDVLAGAVGVVAFNAKVERPNDTQILLTASLEASCLATDSLIYVKTAAGEVFEACPTCIDGQEGFSILLDAAEASDDPGTYTVYIA